MADWLESAGGLVYQWSAAPVNRADVETYLANLHLFPDTIPHTLTELALSQSLARYQIRSVMKGLGERSGGLPYDEQKGLTGQIDLVIASGAALTNAPTPGQAMMLLLDGLQPWRETTLVLDRHHILPLLGLLGEVEPLLPVHLLDSDAFTNLGTVIPVLSDVPEGLLVLSIHVTMSSGKAYDIDVPKGALRRLIVSPGESVALTLDPIPDADIGKGFGVKRQLNVKAGTLGVVIDARGRPLVLPADDDERLERLRHWLWTLGG